MRHLNWIAAAVFSLSAASASAAALQSSDGAITLDVPGAWTPRESPDKGIVLWAQKGKEEIRVRALDEALSDKALKAKLDASVKKLKKDGTKVPKKLSSAALAAGGKIYFTQFVSKGKKYRSGYFNFEDRSYGLLAVNLSNSEFKAIAATLAAPPKPEPAPAPPAPVAQSTAAAPVLSTTPAPAGALAPPPAESAPAAKTDVPAEDLAPLPERRAGFSLYVLFLIMLISAGALGYRAVAGRNRAAEEIPAPVPGAVFPYHIERQYFSFPIVFDVTDAGGQKYSGVSYRIPGLIFGAGMATYFGLKWTLQLAVLAGLDIKNAPTAVLIPVGLAMGLSSFAMLGGLILGMFIRKKLQLRDADGNLLLDVRQKLVTFSSLVFLVNDAEGNELGRIKKKGFTLIQRHWQLLDAQENVLLDIVEDSALRALARKFLGHLWGLLRTNYTISSGGAPVGDLKREWSVWNRYDLHLTPPAGLEPRLALAAVLFVDIIDPDRWHPWHG
ncbi:MAG: hypothetical protein ACHQ51_14955 [Elusimicrobiota bacterium]